jgi:hypothetical protein
MSKPWRVRDEVDDEVEHAFGYRELRKKGEGRALFADYEATYAALRAGQMEWSPEPDVPREMRIFRVRLRRFKYILIFVERDHEYEVICFMHLHREPRYWMSRVDGSADE